MSTKNNSPLSPDMKTDEKGLAEISGIVELILPNAFYRVRINGMTSLILCYLSGKMIKNYIKPALGDKVIIEMSPTDLSKGRIVYLFR
jgi:translation initiation factor IF-1